MKTQSHIIVKFIIICVLLMSCNRQKKEEIKPINNTIVMRKIDINYLNKIKEIHEKYEKITLTENDTVVELADYDDTYFESRRKNNEKVEVRFSYDKVTHLLVASGTYFHDISIGIFKRYNEKGEQIEEINRDENYAFSVYDLIEKIKVTHQIDLNNTTKVHDVSRIFDKSINRYFYKIVYKNDECEKSKYIAVDGQTGEIVSEGILKIKMR